MSLQPGSRIGKYEVLSELGSGGMGEVYKAKDLKLNRDVALKVLPEAFTSDPDRLARFEREARVLASLNHPHIGHLYGVEEARGMKALVLELVDGPTLAERIAQGPIPLGEALPIARQIAEALEAAHEQGVVHRDLKPANVKVKDDGVVKVLDFGLAKAFDPTPDGDSSESPTITAVGVLMGTAAYMSPEQARGQSVDKRSDIWSFGCVLYEMLTGRPVFSRATVTDTLAAIVEHDPDWSLLPSHTPTWVRTLLRRCIEKTSSRRLRDIGDARLELEEAERELDQQMGGSVGAGWQMDSMALGPVVFGLLLASGLGFMVGRLTSGPASPVGTVAVALLPLAYEGPETDVYLAQLFPLVLSRELDSADQLRVAPFEVSRTFAPDEEPVSIGAQLDVDWLVHGRMAIHDDEFVARLELSKTSGEGVVWSTTFTGSVDSSLDSLGGPIARDLGRALGVDLPGSRSSHVGRSLEAFKLYLEGKRFLEGLDRRAEKNYQRAVAAFEKALELDEQFPEARAGLALALWHTYRETAQLDMVERAFSEALRATTVAPTLPEAHLALGVIQLGMGRSAEAADALQRAMSLAPADDTVCRTIGEAYASLGRDDEAEAMFRRAVSLRPNYWEHHLSFGQFYYDRGRFQEANAQWQRVIELRPDSSVGYNRLAASHILAGDLDKAEPLLRAAIRLDPADADAHNNLGAILYFDERYEEAADFYERAITIGGGEAPDYGNLAEAYRLLGRDEDAQAALSHAIELAETTLRVNPDNAELRAGYAGWLAASGRCDASRREAVQAARSGGENPFVHYYVATAYGVCGPRDAAIEHLAQAIEGGMRPGNDPVLKPVFEAPRIRELLEREPRETRPKP